jgi:hypothetical protein
MAPLMQPLASAAGARANEIAAEQAAAKTHFICVSPIVKDRQANQSGRTPFRSRRWPTRNFFDRIGAPGENASFTIGANLALMVACPRPTVSRHKNDSH